MSAKGHAFNFSARVTIPWESASVFLGPRRRRASRILILIVFLRFINVMGSSYRSENSRFRAAIKKISRTRRGTPPSASLREICAPFPPLPPPVDEAASRGFQHLGLGSDREFRYYRLPSDFCLTTVLQLMNGTRGRFMHSLLSPSIWSILSRHLNPSSLSSSFSDKIVW